MSGIRHRITFSRLNGETIKGYSSDGDSFLTVWDTQTGKVLKNWERAAQVAFNPSRPILAILEPNGENTTRLGLWDFSPEAEKK